MDSVSVLLVDDEQEFAITLAERLELRGLHVRTAFNGQEGLLQIMQNLPDVVIVDMYMPGLSGADMTQALKGRYPDLPVIMLTGHAAMGANCEESEENETLSGVYACLTKPVSLEIVWDTLHAAVKAAQQKKYAEGSHAQQ